MIESEYEYTIKTNMRRMFVMHHDEQHYTAIHSLEMIWHEHTMGPPYTSTTLQQTSKTRIVQILNAAYS